MKITVLLLFSFIFCLHAEVTHSQNLRFSIRKNNTKLEKVMSEIEQQSNYLFVYNEKVDVNKTVSVNIKNLPLQEALKQLFANTDINYAVDGSYIILSVNEIKSVDEIAQQQQRVVTGRVIDDLGEPMTGVSILEKGTTSGTITDMEGNYRITLTGERSVLQFSFIGYTPQEITVAANQTQLNVTMREDAAVLDEIVIVSYGTQKKRDVTGSISKVDGNALSDLPVAQIGQKLQGQVAGVQINQVSGQPGQGMTFRIRGAASVNSGNEPLFVVDGIPVSSGINNISPEEIESFSVLKDASATSLYGSRAANGVILITTKRGKSGKTEIAVNAYYGIQTLRGLKKPDVMNGEEYARYKKEFYEDKARYEGYTDGVPAAYQDPSIYGKGTNWYDELTRSAAIQNYSLSITSGKDKFNSAIFIGYFKQDGIMINTGYQRVSARANMDYQLHPKIKLGLNIAPTFTIGENQGVDGHRNVLGAAIEAPPIIGPYDEQGNLRESLSAPGAFNQVNWVRKMQERIDKNKTTTTLANFFAEIDLYDGLKYKLQAGADISSNNHRKFNPSTSAGSWNSTPPWKASGSYATGFSYNWIVENMLTYSKTFADIHTLDVLAGYSAQKSTWEGSTLNGSDFPGDEIPWMDAAATKGGSNNTNNTHSWAVASMIGRINYSLMDRYLLQVSFRRDGCSRFGPDNRYANFPSFSAGWIVSDEKFMEPVTSVMNYLKLRASYGLTGNNNYGNYNHIVALDDKNYVFGDALVPGKALNGIGNKALTWEKNRQLNIGVDMGFLNDRIYFMYEYYHKKTEEMLYQIDIPVASGFDKIHSNVGDFKSWGHEFTLQSRNLVGEFKWTTNFNISFNKNEVLKLGTNNTPMGAYGKDSDFNRLQVGQPIGVFVGFIYDGVYMTQEDFDKSPKHATSDVGTAKMRDIGGPDGKPDGVITFEDDRTIIGDPNPDFIYGITNEFTYKNFDLSILISGQVGGDVLNANYEDTENLDGVFNVRKYVANRWRSLENPGDGLVPRTKSGTTELYRFCNSHWVEDGSYLAIKNVTLGYSLPIKPNNLISRARLYFSVQQLAVFSKYKGLNPEIGIYDSGNANRSWKGLGVDRTSYPIPRTFTIGCNITF